MVKIEEDSHSLGCFFARSVARIARRYSLLQSCAFASNSSCKSKNLLFFCCLIVLLKVVHALGVNFRFLLDVRRRSHNSVTLDLLLLEVASRQIKKMLRKLLRSTLASANGIHDVQAKRENFFLVCFVLIFFFSRFRKR